MARNALRMQDPSSDDDTPEFVSHTTSKADAKRNEKARRNFETEERARTKARNRARDQRLKERARVTKGEQSGKEVKLMDPVAEGADEDKNEVGEDVARKDDVEARMLRAMRDAEREIEGEEEELGEMEVGEDMASGSDDDEDTGMSGESDVDPEANTDDEDMDEDEEPSNSCRPNIHRPSKKANYLSDELFVAAFASQNSPLQPKKKAAATQQVIKKRRRTFNAHPKDVVIGGRTIRTLPRPSDPHSQATARSVPSARARDFVDRNLAMRDKQTIVKAKKKGWERRAANVGVMKCQGAPHGFARSIR